MLDLPISQGLYDFEQRTVLEGVEYIFRYRWNTRAEAWYLDLSDATGTLLVGGRKLSVDLSLFDQFPHLEVPPGQVVAFDTTSRETDPELTDLGVRVLMTYIGSTEVIE